MSGIDKGTSLIGMWGQVRQKRMGSTTLRSQVSLKPRTFWLRSIIPRRDESHKCITGRLPAVFSLTVFAVLQMLLCVSYLTHHSQRLACYFSPNLRWLQVFFTLTRLFSHIEILNVCVSELSVLFRVLLLHRNNT